MLKILHIIPCLRKGGAERLVLDIVLELQHRSDVLVELVTFTSENAYQTDYPTIHPTVISSWVQASIFKPWTYHIQELQSFVDSFTPDVIHTHLFEADFVSRCVRYPKAKWFSHCHDNMKQFRSFDSKTLCNKNLLTNWYEKHRLLANYKRNGGTTFVAISADTLKFFEQNGGDNSVEFLANAIQCGNFASAKIGRVSSNTLRLINIASFQVKKNQQFIVEVAKELKNRDVDFSIAFLGDGTERDHVQQRVAEYGLESFCTFCGNVNNVSQYLQQSDIYIHTAKYEPFGLVLIEAMAAGLPVVCLDAKGNRDIMEQGKNGYIINEQIPSLFADAVLKIWNDKTLYDSMSAYAQDFAMNYDITEYVDRLVDLYTRSSDRIVRNFKM